MKMLASRLLVCVRKAMPKSLKLCLWLFKIILPISLLVKFLQYWGVIGELAVYISPLFNRIGLPGESAIVFITSCFLPLYAPIAVMTSMALTMREATILALMCLISHNLPVECSITSKTGSSFWGMMVFRISMSFLVAVFLNTFLPEYPQSFGLISQPENYMAVTDVLKSWLITSLSLVGTITCVVSLLMILQGILEEFSLMDIFSRPLVPIVEFFGMSSRAPFLWIVGNIVGLAYGGAVMVDMVDSGKISKKEANLVNTHLSVSHSLLEDTMLFVVLGINFWWIVGTRLLFAWLSVWLLRLFKRLAGKEG